MSIGVRVGGAWKDVNAASVRVGGAWKSVSQAYVRVAGVWKELLGKPIEMSYLGTATSNSGLTTYTFANRSLGTPAGDRHILVGVGARAAGGRTLDSVTVAGIPATEIRNDLNTASGNTTVTAWFIAAVPTGTTGDVVCTFSGAMNRAAVALLSLNKPQSLTEVSGGADTTTPYNATLSVLKGGAALGLVFGENSTVTWSGLTGHANTLVGSGQYLGVASSLIAADNPAYAVQGTSSGSSAQMGSSFTSLR